MNSEPAPFVNLAYSLYLYTVRLYEKVRQERIKDLYFFSREGALLKDVFDHFLKQSNSNHLVNTHYLEVSRRSSFLPSLGDLGSEKFEVLFRQYRRMSLSSFLKNLTLDNHEAEILINLGVGSEEAEKVEADLATAEIFQKLIACPFFESLYNQERLRKRAALAGYVGSFTGGKLPSHMYVVDVGWKGSIQDNLFTWLQRVAGADASVTGFYIGLVSDGIVDQKNQKVALLFSNKLHQSSGFRIFNENRSLYEIFLPARHGAPMSYDFDAQGSAIVLRDEFYEQKMIAEYVEPVAFQIIKKFSEITDRFKQKKQSPEKLFKIVKKKHMSMVFSPHRDEIELVQSIYHVENFGAYGQSYFSSSIKSFSIIEKFKYSLRLIKTRRLDEPGFWPYLTLKTRALPGVAMLYSYFRLVQDQLVSKVKK